MKSPFSVYVPLQTNPACQEIFCSAFMEMVATLDMPLPTLLLGDFKDTVTIRTVRCALCLRACWDPADLFWWWFRLNCLRPLSIPPMWT